MGYRYSPFKATSAIRPSITRARSLIAPQFRRHVFESNATQIHSSSIVSAAGSFPSWILSLPSEKLTFRLKATFDRFYRFYQSLAFLQRQP